MLFPLAFALAANHAVQATHLSACAPVTLQTTTAISTVASYFASWNIDSSRNRAFFDTTWSAPELVYLASAIGGARIRFGGSGNDLLNYGVTNNDACPPKNECLNSTVATGLFELAKTSNNGLIFGLNIHPDGSGPSPPKGPWNSTQAASLLRWALAAGTPPWAVELGNEQNTIMTAAEQASAFSVLSALLDDIFESAPSRRPVIVGPDVHGFHNASDTTYNPPVLSYLRDFVANASAMGFVLEAVTHHEYIEIDQDSVLDPQYLDNTIGIAQQVVASVREASKTVPIWAGEIGPHNGDGNTSNSSTCDGNHVCGRFGSTLWYADALGAKAAAGYAGFMRQDLIGADYALIGTVGGTYFPTPDYYFLKIWRDNVSNKTTVLAATAPTQAPLTTRVYAFCGGGEVALILLNLADAPQCMGMPTVATAGGTMRIFTLTPAVGGGVEAQSALLNGSPLALSGAGMLPLLEPVLLPVGDVTLPPLSVTIAIVPLSADVAVCMV